MYLLYLQTRFTKPPFTIILIKKLQRYFTIVLKLNTFSYIKILSRNMLTLSIEIFKQRIER